MCRVLRLSYDYNTKEGVLFIAEDGCTDMSGCIAVFSVLDPAVTLITTSSESGDWTVYRRSGDFWQVTDSSGAVGPAEHESELLTETMRRLTNERAH